MTLHKHSRRLVVVRMENLFTSHWFGALWESPSPPGIVAPTGRQQTTTPRPPPPHCQGWQAGPTLILKLCSIGDEGAFLPLEAPSPFAFRDAELPGFPSVPLMTLQELPSGGSSFSSRLCTLFFTATVICNQMSHKAGD